MIIGLIGRTKILLDTARLLKKNGHKISFIYTSKAEKFYRCSEKDLKKFGEKIKADFFCDSRINTKKSLNKIKKYNCDLAISINCINVLSSEVISCFKNGVWNAHCGDLPKYKGNACPNWAILNNEKKIGLTIHEMDDNQIDTGKVIKKEYLKLSNNTYIGDIYRWMENKTPKMFLESINKLIKNTLKKKRQIKANSLRCYPRLPEDSRINWDNPAADILNLIRASSNPFDGAFTFLNNKYKIIIWRASIEKINEDFFAVPGQVLFSSEGDPIIACKKSALRINEVTFAKNNKNAKEIILKSLRNRVI